VDTQQRGDTMSRSVYRYPESLKRRVVEAMRQIEAEAIVGNGRTTARTKVAGPEKRELAREYGISPSTIAQWRREMRQ